jgi:hypothetical protein
MEENLFSPTNMGKKFGFGQKKYLTCAQTE